MPRQRHDASQTNLAAHRASRAQDDILPSLGTAHDLAREFVAKIDHLARQPSGQKFLHLLLMEMHIHGYLDAWITNAHEYRAEAEPTEPKPPGELERAIAWLREQLADGPMPTATVERLAGGAGISPATLKRARKAVGVRAKKRGGTPPRTWLDLPA
jgi:hypothetical protein